MVPAAKFQSSQPSLYNSVNLRLGSYRGRAVRPSYSAAAAAVNVSPEGWSALSDLCLWCLGVCLRWVVVGMAAGHLGCWSCSRNIGSSLRPDWS